MAAVTGASGYLGSRICATLECRGWQVVRLVRSPGKGYGRACAYDLGAPVSPEVCRLLDSTDVLVHAAYDLSLTRAVDIWRVNVEGTRRLLDAASNARVRRILVLSSMSAFEGTTQLYGRAKLDIETMTEQCGGCAVRPGLVYGEQSGGMAGALAQARGSSGRSADRGRRPTLHGTRERSDDGDRGVGRRRHAASWDRSPWRIRSPCRCAT